MRKRFFLVVLFFFLGFLLFLSVKTVQSSLWDGHSRINFVLASDSVLVASFELGEELTLLSFPKSLYLELPHGFGQYQLGSIYELGELEGRGGELLRETMENYLGIPMAGFIKLSNCRAAGIAFGDARQIVKLSNCLILLLWGKGETNLSKWDLLRLWWQIRKLRADKVKMINFSETKILTKENLPDGSEVFLTEVFRLDELVKKHFADSQIKKESLTIEVQNATDHPGLAQRLARLVTNMGGEVISVGNADAKIQNSKFKIQNEKWEKSYTVQKLEKILEVKTEVGEMGESRADLLISLGEDYWEKWYNK